MWLAGKTTVNNTQVKESAEDVSKQYFSELQHLQGRMSQIGTFEIWEAIMGEMDRFEEEKDLRPVHAKGQPEMLRRIQLKYMGKIYKAEQEDGGDSK